MAAARFDLAVGRVVDVTEHPGARAPSYLLAVDLGPRGRREATVPRGDYRPEELTGRQVVCALQEDEMLLLAAQSHTHGLVLLQPDREVEDGTPVA